MSSSKKSVEKLPKIAPTENEILKKIEPTIAKPTLIGIFLNEPKKNKTIRLRYCLKNIITAATNFL